MNNKPRVTAAAVACLALAGTATAQTYPNQPVRMGVGYAAGGGAVEVIDQTKLPHRFETVRLTTLEQAAHAIKTMVVRGAPLIGRGRGGLPVARPAR